MEAGPWQDLPGMASLLEMAVTPLRTGTWPSLPSPVTGSATTLHLVIDTSLREAGHCGGKPSHIFLQ